MRARGGFTILEVLAALGVLAVSMTGAAFLLASAFGTYRHQDRTIEVARVVHDRMETLSATHYNVLVTELKRARRPGDPFVPGRPSDEDFVSQTSGEATARFELDPPVDPRHDWQPRPKFAAGSVMSNVSGAAPRINSLKAVYHLQFWDPEFDSPSLADKGLIRATFQVQDTGGITRQATKYVARTESAEAQAPEVPAPPVKPEPPAATPVPPVPTPLPALLPPAVPTRLGPGGRP